MIDYDPRPFLVLRAWATLYDDLQRQRIGSTNRAERAPIPREQFTLILDSLGIGEHDAQLHMWRAYRAAAPAAVRAWQKDSLGIGEHLLARLLGEVGHPRVALPMHWEGEGVDRHLVAGDPYVRMVSQLWSLCGHGDPRRRIRRGISAEELAACGNPRAKMLVRLLAEGAIKEPGARIRTDALPSNQPSDTGAAEELAIHPAIPKVRAPLLSSDNSQDPTKAGAIPRLRPSGPEQSGHGQGGEATTEATPKRSAPRRSWPYREVYDKARFTYAERVHADLCVRCGPSGSPAAIGTPWSAGHQHAAALRKVGKEILRDLWTVAAP